MTNGMTRSRSMCTPSALGGGLASLDLISRMLRKETPAVRFAAVHRYDEPMTIMLVPLTEAERPALIADFQESFEHFQGNPQGSFVGGASRRARAVSCWTQRGQCDCPADSSAVRH